MPKPQVGWQESTVRCLSCCQLLRCAGAGQVWTFIMSDTAFRTVAHQHSSLGYAPEVVTGKVKIVCVDARLVEKDAAEQQA